MAAPAKAEEFTLKRAQRQGFAAERTSRDQTRWSSAQFLQQIFSQGGFWPMGHPWLPKKMPDLASQDVLVDLFKQIRMLFAEPLKQIIEQAICRIPGQLLQQQRRHFPPRERPGRAQGVSRDSKGPTVDQATADGG